MHAGHAQPNTPPPAAPGPAPRRTPEQIAVTAATAHDHHAAPNCEPLCWPVTMMTARAGPVRDAGGHHPQRQCPAAGAQQASAPGARPPGPPPERRCAVTHGSEAVSCPRMSVRHCPGAQNGPGSCAGQHGGLGRCLWWLAWLGGQLWTGHCRERECAVPRPVSQPAISLIRLLSLSANSRLPAASMVTPVGWSRAALVEGPPSPQKPRWRRPYPATM